MNIYVESTGFVVFCGHRYRCALGRSGLSRDKREGDGSTPIGTFKLGRVFYRPDRNPGPPITGLSTQQIDTHLGWCDDPTHPDYNQLITLPHPARHERLWRDDRVYDVIVEVLYNVEPVIPDHGSAIFIHVAKPDYAPTEGCIALEYHDLLALLRECNEGDAVAINTPNTV